VLVMFLLHNSYPMSWCSLCAPVTEEYLIFSLLCVGIRLSIA
jgi:hypothetical protein